MNEKIMEQFSPLKAEALSHISAGDKVGVGEFLQALGVCTVAGAGFGSIFPIVGTIGGAVLGAQYCTGAWAILRTH